MSIRGRARVDRDCKTIDEFWSSPQKLSFPQGKDDPNLIVLRIRVRDAAYWESAGNFVVRALDFAKVILSNTPRGLGRHGMLNGST